MVTNSAIWYWQLRKTKFHSQNQREFNKYGSSQTYSIEILAGKLNERPNGHNKRLSRKALSCYEASLTYWQRVCAFTVSLGTLAISTLGYVCFYRSFSDVLAEGLYVHQFIRNSSYFHAGVRLFLRADIRLCVHRFIRYSSHFHAGVRVFFPRRHPYVHFFCLFVCFLHTRAYSCIGQQRTRRTQFLRADTSRKK